MDGQVPFRGSGAEDAAEGAGEQVDVVARGAVARGHGSDDQAGPQGRLRAPPTGDSGRGTTMPA